jgi:hypothetical protein
LREFFEGLILEPLELKGVIDSGAEEELYRRGGQEAAKEALAKRWESADEQRDLECQECGEQMGALGSRGRRLQTLCGTMKIDRQVYYCARCGRTEAPLDERLGITEGGMTPGLMRVVCRTALEMPYEQSESLLTDTLGFCPCSGREIERVAKRHGEKIERSEGIVESAKVARPPRPPRRRRKKARYCAAIDAVMIPGLPDAEKHCLVWHDVKVGVVFDRTEIDPSTYVAGRERVEAFGNRFWNHLQSRGLDEKDFCLVLGDGATWIWNLADLHLPGVPQLLDFYHASEHLYGTARAVWPKKTADLWWDRRKQQLKEGELGNFFASLKWLERSHSKNYKGEEAQSPARLLGYFEENRERLIYRWALDHRLPIGSGAVESACRHIVQQRLKLSGMRWSDVGAQAILNLRTLHRNGEFEAYWEGSQAASF